MPREPLQRAVASDAIRQTPPAMTPIPPPAPLSRRGAPRHRTADTLAPVDEITQGVEDADRADRADGRKPTRRFPELLRQRHRDLGTTADRDLDAIEMVTHVTRLVARLVQDFEQSVHRPLGSTWAGFRILNVLWIFDEVDQQEIERLSGSSKASVSSALMTLENRGLIERRRDPKDRRRLLVQLTDAGRQELEKAISSQTERERAWTRVLSDQEIQQLIVLLSKVVNQPRPE
jgi:DNA-binding MarR family transcriptional regulator